MNKKILVTGATGYIGSHLVKRLADYGHYIVGTDFNFFQNDIKSYVSNLIHWDIRMPTKIFQTDFDAVVHLAALTRVSDSVDKPFDFYNTNIHGTNNVITSISYDNFINCSTGGAFQPDANPYAMSKRAAEDLIRNLPKYSICRFYNVCGNDGFHKFDNDHYHLIRKAAAVANDLYDHIAVFGTDYNTRDGTTVRNYTHVNDIVSALCRLIDHGPTHDIECLGNTTGYTVLEVLKVMQELSGKKFNIQYAGRRPGDAEISVIPKQSEFFKQEHSLEDQCASALKYEI